jgi:hypothetical protein
MVGDDAMSGRIAFAFYSTNSALMDRGMKERNRSL